MNEQQKFVYVVTSGSYSDYHIDRVFSTKEKADAFMNGCEDVADYCVEEYPVDAPTDNELVRFYEVALKLKTGQFVVFQSTPEGDLVVRDSAKLVPRGARECNVSWHEWCGGERGFGVRVESPVSAEHAKKVAVEKRQEWFRDRAVGADSFKKDAKGDST